MPATITTDDDDRDPKLRVVLEKVRRMQDLSAPIAVFHSSDESIVELVRFRDGPDDDDGQRVVVKVRSDGEVDQEVAIMEAIRAQTVIPVPEPYAHGEIDGYSWLITELVPNAITLEDYIHIRKGEVWGGWASMRDYLEQLRKVDLGDMVALLKDPYYLSLTNNIAKPYVSEQEFLNARLKTFGYAVEEGVADHHTHLCHMDLMPRNVLVHPKTGKIQAIIDWEVAGLYPDYYEYFQYIHFHGLMYHDVPAPGSVKTRQLSDFMVKWLELFLNLPCMRAAQNFEDFIYFKYRQVWKDGHFEPPVPQGLIELSDQEEVRWGELPFMAHLSPTCRPD